MFSMFRSSRIEEPVGTEPPVDYKLATDAIKNAEGIPLRLTPKERKMQRIVRGVMQTSSYTDKVDDEVLAKKGKRQMVMLREIQNALVGMVVSNDLGDGSKLLSERDFHVVGKLIQRFVEVSRRYKIMNPDLLRTDYVKFLYLVQDAMGEEAKENLGFSIATPVRTVHNECKRLGVVDMLKDPRLGICITPVPKISNHGLLNKALRFKDVTVNRVVKEYASKSNGASAEQVELCIRSLNDANTFDNTNVDSTDDLIKLLKDHFSPDAPRDRQHDLSIAEGKEGSRLTHEHKMQYAFVLQSLTLWKNISRQMFRLWIVAEGDLLNQEAAPYEFRSTGQGYQRVQQAPKLYKALSDILDDTKREVGGWVGSDKIHLGDNQVPNAFHFIDKYAQISRIIIPVLRTLDHIDQLKKDADMVQYFKEVWGSKEGARQEILVDFFRHAFDGSGGDNMDDAGSCIDGRLTSAWNWCNSLREKPYYPLFLLAGFNSFDGDLTL